MTPEPLVLALLGLAALLAGLVDAVAGGGGLITMPALLSAGLPPHAALATNKGQSVFGSTGALLRFWRSPLLDRRRAPVAFLGAAVGAALGVLLVQLIAPAVLRPVVMVLLLLCIALVLGSYGQAPRPRTPRGRFAGAATAGGIGCYDGFFGPGTGTFLILAYTRWWGDPPAEASANAKVANSASNLAALAVFAACGQVVWLPALVMGLGQLIGGWLGAHLVVRHGTGLVRVMVVVVSLALLAKLGWDEAQRWV